MWRGPDRGSPNLLGSLEESWGPGCGRSQHLERRQCLELSRGSRRGPEGLAIGSGSRSRRMIGVERASLGLTGLSSRRQPLTSRGAKIVNLVRRTRGAWRRRRARYRGRPSGSMLRGRTALRLAAARRGRFLSRGRLDGSGKDLRGRRGLTGVRGGRRGGRRAIARRGRRVVGSRGRVGRLDRIRRGRSRRLGANLHLGRSLTGRRLVPLRSGGQRVTASRLRGRCSGSSMRRGRRSRLGRSPGLGLSQPSGLSLPGIDLQGRACLGMRLEVSGRRGVLNRPRPASGAGGGKKPFAKTGGPFAKFADGKKPFRKPGPGKKAAGSGRGEGGFKPVKRRPAGDR